MGRESVRQRSGWSDMRISSICRGKWGDKTIDGAKEWSERRPEIELIQMQNAASSLNECPAVRLEGPLALVALLHRTVPSISQFPPDAGHMKPYLETVCALFSMSARSATFIKGKMWVEMDMDHQIIGHSIMGDRGGQRAVGPVCKVRIAHL